MTIDLTELQNSVNKACDEIDRLRAVNADLISALRLFLDDDRFQVTIGGNPIVVEKMIEQAHAALAKATPSLRICK